MKACGCSLALAVRGNHDSGAPFPAGVTDLHLKIIEYQGLTFGGFNGAWKYKPQGHYLYEQDQVRALLKDFPAVDVFVAHHSPRHVHDKEEEVHFGFEAFSEYIQRHRPKLLLHGHQHVNIETRIGTTESSACMVTGSSPFLHRRGGASSPPRRSVALNRASE